MVVYLTQSLRRDREPEITGTFIDSKLEAAGELTSAKMIYNGLIHYSDGSIPFLTQKAFNMTYRAEVRAGVDLSKANTEVTDSEVTVTLPAVEIFDISIDNDSIQYYDEKAALLNWERKEDAMDAIASAKEDVEQQTKEMDDLETMAQEQTKTLITGMLSETVSNNKTTINTEVVHAGMASNIHMSVAKAKIEISLCSIIVSPATPNVSTGRNHNTRDTMMATASFIPLETILFSASLLAFFNS